MQNSLLWGKKIYHLFSDSQKIMEKLVENYLGNGIHKLLAQYHTLLIDVLSRVVTWSILHHSFRLIKAVRRVLKLFGYESQKHSYLEKFVTNAKSPVTGGRAFWIDSGYVDTWILRNIRAISTSSDVKTQASPYQGNDVNKQAKKGHCICSKCTWTTIFYNTLKVQYSTFLFSMQLYAHDTKSIISILAFSELQTWSFLT